MLILSSSFAYIVFPCIGNHETEAIPNSRVDDNRASDVSFVISECIVIFTVVGACFIY